MPEKERWNFTAFKTPAILMAVFWSIAIALWLTTGKIFYLGNFGYIGTALGLGMGIYSALPRRKRWIGRRIAQFLIGVYMLVFLGFIERENMQIEGFFFYLLAGIFAGAVIHYLVAKLVGPLLFNRGWCGWACWTAMLLDLLPFRHNKKGRLPGKWGWLRQELCNECGVCVRVCPMDIDIPAYTRRGLRVLSTECILCFECVDECNQGALDSTFKWDGYQLELLRTGN
jgi:polyferredoxin